MDGNHSKKGSEQDLLDVLPRLKVGGVVDFDDICLILHLAKVWKQVVAGVPRFATRQFTELGYGVALAICKEI
jgi:predicted O-methyltransferase YrrM